MSNYWFRWVKTLLVLRMAISGARPGKRKRGVISRNEENDFSALKLWIAAVATFV